MHGSESGFVHSLLIQYHRRLNVLYAKQRERGPEVLSYAAPTHFERLHFGCSRMMRRVPSPTLGQSYPHKCNVLIHTSSVLSITSGTVCISRTYWIPSIHARHIPMGSINFLDQPDFRINTVCQCASSYKSRSHPNIAAARP